MSSDKEQLFIKEIQISNCGRYYGDGHTILFSNSPGKNINIIIGWSGRGKSTIFDLIYWCFYGEFRNSKEEQSTTDYGLVNDDALSNLPKGKSVTASVVISLHDKRGEKYRLTREVKAVCNRESGSTKFEQLNNSRVSDGIDFDTSAKLVFKNDHGDMQIEDNPSTIENKISQYFPKHLSDFFLFDGEDLIKFRTQGHASELIKNGITKISGLGLVSYLIKNSSKTADNIQRSYGGKSAQAAPHQAEVDRLKGEINDINEKIRMNTKELDKQTVFKDKIIASIAKSESSQKLAKEKKKNEASIKHTKQNIRDINQEFKEFLFENIPYVLLRDTLKNAEDIFAQLEREDKIPPSISSSAIDKILNSDPLRCVCGREFEKKDAEGEPWRILNQMKDTIIADDLSQAISLGRNLLSQIMDNTENQKLKTKFSKHIEKRRQVRDELNLLKEKDENLELKIKETAIMEGGDDLITRKKEYTDKIDKLHAEIVLDKDKRDNLIEDLDVSEQKLQNAMEKAGKYDKELNKISLGKAVSKFAQQLEKRIEEILREKTEQATSKYFLESAPEKETFDHVEISPNYDITVKDEKNKIPLLSKGQAHVLGLSYVAGIREVTSTSTFLVIDSPLHNISGYARNDIAMAYSQYLPGVQIILLVTDTEYLQGDSKGAEPVQKILRNKGNIGQEYEIQKITTENGIDSRKVTVQG